MYLKLADRVRLQFLFFTSVCSITVAPLKFGSNLWALLVGLVSFLDLLSWGILFVKHSNDPLPFTIGSSSWMEQLFVFEESKTDFHSTGKCWEIGILLGYVLSFWLEPLGLFMTFRELRELVMSTRGSRRGSGSCGLFWKYCNRETSDSLESVHILSSFEKCSTLLPKSLIFTVGNSSGSSLIALYPCCTSENSLGTSLSEEHSVGSNLTASSRSKTGYFIGGKWRWSSCSGGVSLETDWTQSCR